MENINLKRLLGKTLGSGALAMFMVGGSMLSPGQMRGMYRNNIMSGNNQNGNSCFSRYGYLGGNGYQNGSYYNNYYNSVSSYGQQSILGNQVINGSVNVSLATPAVTTRNVVIVNDSNPLNRIVLVNNLTGPNSVNVNSVVIRVSASDFDQISNNVTNQTSNTINIGINTGNNTVSFNTVAGNVTTGAVSVSIQ